jgi:hypothetical protein
MSFQDQNILWKGWLVSNSVFDNPFSLMILRQFLRDGFATKLFLQLNIWKKGITVP